MSAIYVIVQRYEQQMVVVETERERRLLAVAARHAIHRAIDRVPGITVEEYDEIATGVREDGGLEAAVHEALRVRLGTTRPDRRRARPGDAE